MAKNLQKRCRAIRTAIQKYNAAAKALSPPRPPLDWSKVSHFNFLEEFTLLQDTRNDIRSKQWAQPLVRETMRAARRVTRAEEEIEHVNREARRIHTSICDEDRLFTEVLSDLQARNDPLSGALRDYCRRRRGVNAHVLAHLLRLYALEGFTGVPGPGTHAGPPRERPRGDSTLAPDAVGTGELPAAEPASPMSIVSPRPVLPSLEALANSERAAVSLDDGEAVAGIDEDDDGAVTELIEHMSNIAVVT